MTPILGVMADRTPISAGDRVRHSGQRWPEAILHGTATVVEVTTEPEAIVDVDADIAWPSAGMRTSWALHHTHRSTHS